MLNEKISDRCIISGKLQVRVEAQVYDYLSNHPLFVPLNVEAVKQLVI